ncbi:MAG: NFYB/HAP3 family transcription factor subunit [Nanoarchaeota archaeon]|nr:NFYB/HAP3 family transcription factor subunit [Nanoarchaeota archaeon]
MDGDKMLVVGSKVKEYVKSKGLNSSGDLIEALNKKVEKLLDEAAERTKANGRKTMRPEDL